MKRILTTIVCVLGLIGSLTAQSLQYGVLKQNKNVLEDFTRKDCGYYPMGHEAINRIMSNPANCRLESMESAWGVVEYIYDETITNRVVAINQDGTLYLSYNEKGLISSYCVSDSSSFMEYEYNDEGILTGYKHTFIGWGGFFETYEYIFTYDAKGQLVRIVSDSEGTKTEFAYNAEGLVSEKAIYSSEEEWVIDSKVSYTYENGNLICEEYYYSDWETGDLYLVEKAVYEYDAKGNCVTKEVYSVEGETETLYLTTKYYYDETIKAEDVYSFEFPESVRDYPAKPSFSNILVKELTYFSYYDKNLGEVVDHSHELITYNYNTEVVSSPLQPINLTAEAISATEVGLSWLGFHDAEYFSIYEVFNDSTLLLGIIEGSSCTIIGLETGTEYCFAVAAVAGYLESELSETVCIATEEIETPVTPEAPTNLRATVEQNVPDYNYKFKVTMSWDYVPFAESYDVYIYTSSYPEGLYFGSTAENEYIAGANSETDFWFSVRAVYSDGSVSDHSETCHVILKDENQLTFLYEGNDVTNSENYIEVAKEINEAFEIQFDLAVSNNTANDMNVVCEIENLSNVGQSYVVWGVCYPPSATMVTNKVYAGEDATFNGHVMFIDEEWNELPKGTVIPVRYTFYDESNPSEKYVFNVNYIYSTTRNVLIEEFTGRDCSFCPMGHAAINDVMAENPGKVFAVNYHTLGVFSPTTYPNLNVTESSTFFNAFNISATPSALVNRNNAIVHPATEAFNNNVNSQLSQLTEVKIEGNVAINSVTRQAEITVELDYLSNSNYSTNYLTIMMLQDSIFGSQSGANNYNPEQIIDGEYCHMHVLRDVITDTWGDAITPTTAGTHITKKYIYEIPEVIGDPNGVEVDLDNIYFLAFVTEKQDGTPTRPVLNVNKLVRETNSDEPVTPQSPLTFLYEGNDVTNSINNIVIEKEINESFEIQFDLVVGNNTANNMNIVCEIEDLSNVGQCYICWGNCYTPGTTMATNTVYAGEDAIFNGHAVFYDEDWNELPKGTVIPVRYTFYDESNPSEQYVFNVKFIYENDDTANYWTPDESLYANNMTIITTVEIDGEEQYNPNLELGAFCNGELRGSARLQYVDAPANRYECFLMVYGNSGDDITFRLYDHGTGLESDFRSSEVVDFEVNATIGDVTNPYTVNFIGSVIHSRDLTSGWNWYSTYILNEGAEGLTNLETAVGTNGIQIKNQTKFVNQASGNWYGTLTSTAVEDMFMIQMSAAHTLNLEGYVVNPADHPITLGTNWKWISYPLAAEMSVEEAFASANPSNGDYVKSQKGFAQYYEGLGWSGTLKTMTPGMGYMYQNTSGYAKTLVYPMANAKSKAEAEVEEDLHWTADATKYPMNMTVIAVVEDAAHDYEVAAFSNGECRGAARPVYIEALGQSMIFMTIYGDDNDNVSFRYYDVTTGEEVALNDEMTFEVNATHGDVMQPYVMTLSTMGIDEASAGFNIYPNPVNDKLYIETETVIEEIVVYDVYGRVQNLRISESQNLRNSIDVSDLNSGVYFIQIKTEEGNIVKRIIKN